MQQLTISYFSIDRFYMQQYDVGDDDSTSDDDEGHVLVDVAADTSASLFTNSLI